MVVPSTEEKFTKNIIETKELVSLLLRNQLAKVRTAERLNASLGSPLLR